MGQALAISFLSIEDYLKFEASSQVRHEYAAGNVFAMAGASERHNRISMNISSRLHQATRTSKCTTFQSDMRVRIDPPKPRIHAPSTTVIYYPDVMVCCEANDTDQYLKTKPCLIIEVLSESTERIDRGEKLHNYQAIAELQAYVLISQDTYRVDMFSRTADGWRFDSLSDPLDVLKLPCPDTQMSLAEIYERVVFEVGG